MPRLSIGHLVSFVGLDQHQNSKQQFFFFDFIWFSTKRFDLIKWEEKKCFMKYETSGLVRTCSDLTLISSSVIYACLIFLLNIPGKPLEWNVLLMEKMSGIRKVKYFN